MLMKMKVCILLLRDFVLLLEKRAGGKEPEKVSFSILLSRKPLLCANPFQ